MRSSSSIPVNSRVKLKSAVSLLCAHESRKLEKEKKLLTMTREVVIGGNRSLKAFLEEDVFQNWNYQLATPL